MQKPIWTLIALALSAATADAQATFGPQISVPGTPNLKRLKPFDVDGDGDMDLLGTSSQSSTGHVVLVENLDAGGLGTPQQVTVGIGNLVGLDFADVDGDGLRDLILGDSFNDAVVWCKGLPSGSFDPPSPVGDADDPNGVAAADLDGDGDIDVACTFEGASVNQVGWFQNDGAGNFSSFIVISGALNDPEDVLAADLDNDGDQDLVTASSLDDKIAWYRNLGGGNFAAQSVISTGADGARRIAIGDINGDGFLDVASAALNGGQVAWYSNSGGTGFVGQPDLESGAGSISSVAIADVDLDGDMDVIAARGGTNGARWYENVGFGFFASVAELGGSIFSNSDVAAFDIDGDSDVDIVSARVAWNENETRLEGAYCASNPNSTGVIAETFGTGSNVASMDLLTLNADQLPANVFGYFLASTSQGLVNMPAGSQGVLCLGGAIGRYSSSDQIRFSGGSQRFQLKVKLMETPHPSLGLVSIQAAQTWYFQAWFRDSSGGSATSNFSSGLAMTFR